MKNENTGVHYFRECDFVLSKNTHGGSELHEGVF